MEKKKVHTLGQPESRGTFPGKYQKNPTPEQVEWLKERYPYWRLSQEERDEIDRKGMKAYQKEYRRNHKK